MHLQEHKVLGMDENAIGLGRMRIFIPLKPDAGSFAKRFHGFWWIESRSIELGLPTESKILGKTSPLPDACSRSLIGVPDGK